MTVKEEPGDFDVCWEAEGVALDLLDPVFLDFSTRRRAQKRRFGGEFFPADAAADISGMLFLEYFQQDRHTGQPKGVLALDLGGIS